MAIAVNAGMDPGKDGENIRRIKPTLEQGEDDDSATGVKWWPDDDDPG
jgi:hypothetical protein